MAWPTPHSFASGEVITAANLNTFQGALTYLFGGGAGNRPYLRVYQATAQTFTTGVSGTLHLDTLEEDTDGGWNASTWTYTVATAGIWLMSAGNLWATNSTGTRTLILPKPRRTISAAVDSNGWDALTYADRLAAGATVNVQVEQTSGGNLQTNPGSLLGVFFHMVWLGN